MSDYRKGFLGMIGNRSGSPAVTDKMKGADGKHPPPPTPHQVLYERQEVEKLGQTRMWCVLQAVQCTQHTALSADDIIKLTRFFVEFVSEPVNVKATKTHL